MRLALAALLVVTLAAPARGHDIYQGLRGKTGNLCCGGDPVTGDCAATVYRERGGSFEFLTREQEWVGIPQERIQFLPIPGDPPSNDSHHAHLCYRRAGDSDRTGPYAENVYGPIYFYCALIPPGAI